MLEFDKYINPKIFLTARKNMACSNQLRHQSAISMLILCCSMHANHFIWNQHYQWDCHDSINDLPNAGENSFTWTDNTLYLSPLHQCYCNDVPIQGVPPHPPHHHNNQVFFLVSPMICTKWVMFRMQGTTEHNQWSEKMTVFFNHFELITDCIATYNIINYSRIIIGVIAATINI